MNIAAPFKQLVERRLWPLAVLLVAALAAVPMLLSKEPEAPMPATSAVQPSNATADAALATQPIVTVGDGAARDARRKVLGARKDPFKPEIRAKKPKVETPAAPAKSSSSSSKDSGSSSSGGVTTPPTPVAPTPVTPTEPVKTYEVWSLKLRFGLSDAAELKTRNVKRLKALPSAAFPALIYLGVLEDHKTAVFLVDHGATVQGDGKCFPSADDCQTLHMKKGNIAFVDAAFEGQEFQFQIEMRGIVREKTTDAKAVTAEAKGGRDALRARMGRVGRLRFDASSGTVKKY